MCRVSSRSWYRSTRFGDRNQNVIYQKCQVPDFARRVKHGLAFLIVGSILFLSYFIWVAQGGGGDNCQWSGTTGQWSDTTEPLTTSTSVTVDPDYDDPLYSECGQMPQLVWISILLFASVLGIMITSICSQERFDKFLTHRNLQIIGGFLVLIFAITNWTYARVSMNEPFDQRTNRHLVSWIVHIQVTLLLYTCIRLPMVALIAIGICNSIIFEVLLHASRDNVSKKLVCAEVFLLLANHLICAKHCLQSEDDLYLTYQGVLDVVIMSKKLEKEEMANRVLINSVMPGKLTEKVMNDLSGYLNGAHTNMRQTFIQLQENVTILFADIVGFTRLSSGLTAAKLVDMLNDLFGRFDFLCDQMKCEKVATLGDCYYCVSGCPEADEDHAFNCVTMGLKVCKTIKVFCKENDVAIESAQRHQLENPDFKGQIVDMRVGVHSGRVISAIVGSSRFKYDVYSKDVSWANKLESTGVPGRVHISGCTRGYLRKRDFELEDGDPRIDNHNARYPRPLEEWLRLFDPANEPDNLKFRFEQIFAERSPEEMDIDRERCAATTWLVVDRDDSDTEETVNARSTVIDVDNGNANGVTRLRHTVVEDPTKVALLENGMTPDVNEEMPHHRATAIAHCIIKPMEKSAADIAEIEDNADMYFRKRSEMSRKELNPFTLNFVNPEESNMLSCYPQRCVQSCMQSCMQTCEKELPHYEQEYRNGFKYRKKSDCDEDVDHEDTFPLARFRKDIVLCIVTQALLYVAVLLSMGYSTASLITFLICFVLSGLFLLAVTYKSLKERLGSQCLTWTWRHLIGAFLLLFPSLPAIVASFFVDFPASANVSGDICRDDYPRRREMLIAVLSASALHHTNFSNLSSNMRSFIALLILVTSFCISAFYMDDCQNKIDYFQWAISLFLLLLLILLENRTYEISHRLNFKAKVQTKEKGRKARNCVQNGRNLLTNIIPEHVIKKIELNEHYSQDHKLVGVFFATVTNFLDLYEEQFANGIEFIRTLSELISDIDELLKIDKYKKQIEKIKTTSATYMGASGLNCTPCIDTDKEHHLETMIEYCIDIQKKVEEFSDQMIWFQFKLRIGAHCGELTSGVMGTRKLLFDIWGNTVNVASRMDSTGLCGTIQVTEDLKDKLSEISLARAAEQRYSWNPRGSIFVKGKGMIKTYLLEKETNL